MDIVYSNFLDRLQFMTESVKTADFIALDTEFSGLAVGTEDQVHAYDQVEDRYQKLRHNCARMNAFQVGIATFKWDEKKQSYTSRPFNCYAFPNSEVCGDNVLQFKSSNIKFLTKNHFDFNKLFGEGLSYQRLCDADKVLSKVNLKQKEY
jgi:hypothetical protein